MRFPAALCFSSLAIALSCTSGSALAVTSSRSVPSALGANGFNASFDGRLYLARDSGGWSVRLLRPEAITFHGDGLPNAGGPMWSAPFPVLANPNAEENALAICEPDKSRAPFACDDAGNASANGPYACYDVVVIDSNAAVAPEDGGFVLRRRAFKVWVANPKSPNATIHKVDLSSTLEPLVPTLKGIEPTVTADGKLLVWQGFPANDGQIDTLVYSYNANPCAASGWTAPKSIAAMVTDPLVTKYPLSERVLRAADGTPFAPSDVVRGAYPWLMPDGDAIVFTAANMPCRATEDPPGCGPRRNAWSVLGYPTNWAIAHVDGGVNPSTTDTVRLFFTSPGAKTFPQLPVTKGIDVWPFFGSNTSNYVELTFDDGLDGQYAGMWHMNESVDKLGNLDKFRTPDVSGYFNTGFLRGGLTFADANDGVLGKSLFFDGVDDRVEVPDSPSLRLENGITVDFTIWPDGSPDCDANNNFRYLIGKGDLGSGAFTIMMEENLAFFGRVNVNGEMKLLPSPPVAPNVWTHVSFEYDGASGRAAWFFDDVEVASADFGKGTIAPSSAPLLIGGPGARAACPDGDGAFRGRLDEVSVSRIARHLRKPELGGGAPVPPLPTSGPSGASSGSTDPALAEDENASFGRGGGDGGCAHAPRGGTPWTVALAGITLALLRLAGARRARSPRAR